MFFPVTFDEFPTESLLELHLLQDSGGLTLDQRWSVTLATITSVWDAVKVVGWLNADEAS